MWHHCLGSPFGFPCLSEPTTWNPMAIMCFEEIREPQNLLRRRQWHPTPVLLPGKSHGQRSLVGCSPWCPEESDTKERLHFHFSLSCIGEGNGNPRKCSWLENPRDGGAWWAAIYGVAQSRTRLKWLSSSSSSGSIVYERSGGGSAWNGGGECPTDCSSGKFLLVSASLHFCPSLFLQFCWLCKLSW